jgi:hypothetical protein
MSADADTCIHLLIRPPPAGASLPVSIESDGLSSQMRWVHTCRLMTHVTSIHTMLDERPIANPYS